MFQIDSNNFWLKINYNLQASAVKHVQGAIEIRIDKSEKMFYIKHKLQILLIKIWYHSIEKQSDTFYTMDKFEIVSLNPFKEGDSSATQDAFDTSTI